VSVATLDGARYVDPMPAGITFPSESSERFHEQSDLYELRISQAGSKRLANSSRNVRRAVRDPASSSTPFFVDKQGRPNMIGRSYCAAFDQGFSAVIYQNDPAFWATYSPEGCHWAWFTVASCWAGVVLMNVWLVSKQTYDARFKCRGET
jgi:hypothetical protein